MAFKPTQDRALIRASQPEVQTSSGFFIPQACIEAVNSGVVIATGPGRTTRHGVLVPMTVAIGDTITYETGSAVPIRVNGEDLLVVKEEHIIATVV